MFVVIKGGGEVVCGGVFVQLDCPPIQSPSYMTCGLLLTKGIRGRDRGLGILRIVGDVKGVLAG